VGSNPTLSAICTILRANLRLWTISCAIARWWASTLARDAIMELMPSQIVVLQSRVKPRAWHRARRLPERGFSKASRAFPAGFGFLLSADSARDRSHDGANGLSWGSGCPGGLFLPISRVVDPKRQARCGNDGERMHSAKQQECPDICVLSALIRNL
jgi:hypothetical protein